MDACYLEEELKLLVLYLSYNQNMGIEGSGYKPEQQVESMLSPEVKKALTELDNLEDIGSGEKMDILGAFIGVKPVAYPYDYYTDEDELLPIPNMEKLEQIIKALGLKVRTEIKSYSDEDKEGGYEDYDGDWEAIVSKDEELIKEFVFTKNDFSVDSEFKMGVLLGYPETGTKAAVGQIDTLSEEKIIELQDDHVEILFHGAVMSKDFWKEELEAYGGIIMKATKKYLPRTYSEVLRKLEQEQLV